ASTLATGTMGALSSVYHTVRDDAAAAMARADAEQARVALLKDVHKKLDVLTACVDAVTSELETIKAKERADAEAAAQAEEERRLALEEDPLEDPPDLLEYRVLNPPSKIGDTTPAPSGELHALPPKSEDDDNVGDLPKELEEPPDPVPEPRGSVVSQPVSISLNEK